MKIKLILFSIAAVFISSAGVYMFSQKPSEDNMAPVPQDEGVYDPQINPSEFTTDITNKYFTLTPGKKFVYESETEDGRERIEVEVLGETRNVLGVETVVYWDRVWLDDVLIEDTRDYLAQDAEGNVWYFGEAVDNYENGTLKDHAGSWLAGVDGAKPGIWMKADPTVGQQYRQEYYPGEAEDMGEVLSLTETVTTPSGTYQNCLKTRDWTPLDLSVEEHKYYCIEVGGLVLEVHTDSGERTELIAVQ